MSARKHKRRRNLWHRANPVLWIGEYEREYDAEIDAAVAALCAEEDELWLQQVKELLE